MMLPPFSLPSRPVFKITLREATVADLIDFADVDPAHEEEVTTIFLNRLQDKATFKDAKEWTGEDRRFALFWYWLHTTDDCDVAIRYQCRCGKQHTFLQDYRKVAEGYIAIKGLPERDIEMAGDDSRYTVKPLTGADLEVMEALRAEGHGRALAIQLGLERVLRSTGCDRAKILSLPCTGYTKLRDLIDEAMDDMRHGLDTDYEDGELFILLPPHQCPEDKEVTTRVRVSFRYLDFIPAL